MNALTEIRTLSLEYKRFICRLTNLLVKEKWVCLIVKTLPCVCEATAVILKLTCLSHPSCVIRNSRPDISNICSKLFLLQRQYIPRKWGTVKISGRDNAITTTKELRTNSIQVTFSATKFGPFLISKRKD